MVKVTVYCSRYFSKAWKMENMKGGVGVYFSYIVAVSFVVGGNRRNRRKPPTCRQSLHDKGIT